MMMVRWSWCAVALVLVGCSGGSAGAGTAEPPGAGAAAEDASADSGLVQGDAGATSGDANAVVVDAGDPDPPTASFTGTGYYADPRTAPLSFVYALKYGTTIEVAFSEVSDHTSAGRMVVLVYQPASGVGDYTYARAEARGHTRCKESFLSAAPRVEDYVALKFDARGRVSGGPVHPNFGQAIGTYVAEFHAQPVADSTYITPCQP